MAEISRVTLFGKLNGLSYKAVDSALVFCKLRGNPYVELEHWVGFEEVRLATHLDVPVAAVDDGQ